MKSLKNEATDDKEDERKKKYLTLLALFIDLLHSLGNDATEEEALEKLAELRMEMAMDSVFKGFKIDKEYALLLLRNLDDYNLTEMDKKKRDRLVAAVNNLSDFSTCEEYQVLQEVKRKKQLLDIDDIDFDDEEEMEEFEEICERYNDTYASTEDNDIEYALGIALMWIGLSENSYLEYMTQNDDRVRPWHYALQGFTAKVSEFPDWMIPPIEWRCRCFLVSLSGDVIAKRTDLKSIMAKVPQKPEHLDGVFEESIAKCGRIFSDKHPYFQVNTSDVDMLKRISQKLKDKYYARMD